MTESNDPERNAPNLYELNGHGVRMSYATTSLSGLPRFSYNERGVDKVFIGDQISTEAPVLGSEVTLVVESRPDLETVTVTLLGGRVNGRGYHREPQTLAFRYPQTQTYSSTRLRGTGTGR